MIKEAIILAGGFGTRLQSVVSDVPKPMAPVNNQPFLNYQLRYLKHYGINRVVLSVGYLHEKITEYYGSEFEGINIHYSVETEPLGTGGGIKKAMDMVLSNTVLVLNGDSFFEIDIHSFNNHHISFNSECSIALREVDNAARYGTIEMTGGDGNRGRQIISFKEKNNIPSKGIINGGVYLLNKTTYLTKSPNVNSFSIEKDFFETQLQEIKIFGCLFNNYFIDIGIPEDYAKAQNDFKEFKYR